MHAVVSAAVGVVCLIAAGVLIVAGRWQWPRLIVALVLTGSAGLLSSSVGGWIQRSVTGVDSRIGSFIGQWTGATVTGLLSLILLAVLGFWVWHGRIDTKTVGVAAAVPMTVALIPGPLGTFAVAAVAIVPSVLGGVIAWLFGLG
jgi:hypothetical protein